MDVYSINSINFPRKTDICRRIWPGGSEGARVGLGPCCHIDPYYLTVECDECWWFFEGIQTGQWLGGDDAGGGCRHAVEFLQIPRTFLAVLGCVNTEISKLPSLLSSATSGASLMIYCRKSTKRFYVHRCVWLFLCG